MRHTVPGGWIGIGSAIDGGEARLWVADSGQGVAPKDRDRIFERFVRGADSRRRAEGSGLGLSIVAAIAHAHGGRVDSTPHPGAAPCSRS